VQAINPADAVDLAARLRLGVTRLARKLRQESEPGLTPSQLSALSTIEHRQRVTVGELCAIEQVQPPTMTRCVAALVDAGLASREQDEADRRVAWLRVTPDGATLLSRTRRRKEAFLVRRLRSLSPDELEVLDRAAPILERLVGSSR
jgi:DNA-binding MarR family transcriptional regulator